MVLLLVLKIDKSCLWQLQYMTLCSIMTIRNNFAKRFKNPDINILFID